MKTSYVAIILGFAALVSGASLQKGIQPRLKLNLNSALDTVFTKIRNNSTGFDPFSLPDVEKSFNWIREEGEWKPILEKPPDRGSNLDFPVIGSLVFCEIGALGHAAIQLVIHGDLDLTNGQLWGLSTIARTGDATADLEGSEADLVVKLAFDDFKVQYDFSATIDDLGPSGLAHGEITEFYINAEVLANLSDTTAVKISLKDLEFEHAGKITIDLDGDNEILNDINDALTGVITSILKDQVLSLLQTVVKSVLDDTLKTLTFNLNDLL